MSLSVGGFAHNRHAGQAGWRSQGVAPHPGDAAARHRSVPFSYACFGWLYRHQSVARASFVDQQDVPRAEEVAYPDRTYKHLLLMMMIESWIV
jgi:hypothetical protein